MLTILGLMKKTLFKSYTSILADDFEEKKVPQLMNFVKDQYIINYGSLY